ncbi:geranylgeranyl pyrophosphate synthase [Secundilactobacillus paracollinoides]|uniref:polyprenyl synthetase family protein n=1 Tax=Secundilactobacillus paracollinoides TaxID=240427 RepID=UPI00081A4F15|nr:polyprenyl synthetase family protein [Secundilactobacillus paracollinoides]ANZ62786.1 geranylgeranyl pyrophosphate synthase [Secundilactobacillus paracollinoides]
MVHKLWRQFPQVQKELTQLQPYLLKVITLPNQRIHVKITQLLSAGGKLLRPGFFYLFSEFGDEHDDDRLRAGAASLELLHVATLIHDDVIDRSPLRRGVKTIQTEYGSRNAIYAGDYLFTAYFNEVLKASSDPAVLKLQINSMREILTGELDQMDLNYRFNVSEGEYLNEITGKTAVLFWLSCHQGAAIAGASEAVATLAGQIGLTIGRAYQIMDDILDYDGDEKATRKPVLEDLKSGVYSLPLILALQQSPKVFKPLLKKKQDMTDADVLEVQRLVIENKGVELAKARATEFTEQALDLISSLPDVPVKQDIDRLTRWLLTRNQ